MGWKDDPVEAPVAGNWKGDPVEPELTELQKKARKALPRPATREEVQNGIADAWHKTKLAGSSAVKGFTGLATMLLDSPDPVEAQRAAFTGQDREAFDKSQATKLKLGPLVESIGPKPETTFEKYLDSGARGVGGAFFPVPGTAFPSVGRGLATGLTGGVASEAAGQATATQDNPEGSPVARLLGGLAGGSVAAVPGAGVRTPRIVRDTRSTVEAVGGDAGMQAGNAAAQKAGQTIGAPVLATQGLKDPTPAQGLVAAILRDPKTSGQAHALLNAQTPAAMEKFRELLVSVGAKDAQGRPIVPGQTEVNAVRDALARELVERPQQKAQAVSAGQFRKGAREAFPAEIRFSSAQDVADVQDTMRVLSKSDAGKAFLRKYKALVEDSSILQPNGSPFVKIAGEPTEVYNFRKELQKLAAAGEKDSAVGADITKSVGYKKMVGALDNMLREYAPELTAANDLYSRSMRVHSDPARQGPLAASLPAGKDAMKTPANWEEVNVVLNTPESYSPRDIENLAKSLNRADPKAFPNMVRQNLEARLAGVQTEGRQASTKQVVDAVFGPRGSRQRENTLTSIAESARSQGKDPKAARLGAEALADAMEIVSHDRGGVGMATEAAARSLIGGVGLRGPWATVRGLHFGSPEVDTKALMEALTAPDAGDRLKKIAGFSLARNRVKAALDATKPAVADATASKDDEFSR